MERKFVELYPSLGLLTLGAYLREHGVDVSMVDLTFERDTRPVDRAIRVLPSGRGRRSHEDPDRAPRVEIARKARDAGLFSLAGGPDSASRPQEYLDGGFDAVVPAEGEAATVDLALRLREGPPLARTPGVITRDGPHLVRGPTRPFLADLDELPLPAWDLVDMEGYLGHWQKETGERRAAVLTSRGCPFDCSWCSKPTFGRTFRQQSPERVLRELLELKRRYRVDYVRFCDDVFGVSRTWLEQLLDRMIDSELGLRFECLARVDLLKPDLLGRMREAGLARVYVGVESGSQRMLDAMNRGTKLAQVERTAEALRAAGVRQFWFLMLGYPGETIEDIEATFRLFRRFSPEEYSVSIAVPVPGTRFYDKVKGTLRGRAASSRKAGGSTLLFEAAYGERLYRWEQARFGLEAALGKARRRFQPRVVEKIGRVADRFHEEVATPLLAGKRSGPRMARPR